MPDFVPVSHSIEVRIGASTASGKKMYNIIHADCGPVFPTYSDCEAVGQAVADWCLHYYKLIFSNTVTIREVRARSNAQEPGPVWVDGTISQVGSLAGDPVPMAQSLCCNLLTGLTGASHRGRFFVFQADETKQLGGLWISGYADDVTSALGFLKDGLDLAGYAWAVESRAHLSLYPILSYLPQLIPSTLKSRKPNRGI